MQRTMQRSLIALIITLLSTTSLLAAEANQSSQLGRFFINPLVGGLEMESSSYDPEVNYSLGGGYNYTANLASEVRLSYSQEKSNNDSDAQTAFIGAIYHLMPEQQLVPYLAVGVGTLFIDADDRDEDFEFQVNYGAGVKYFLNKDWAVNGEIRHMISANGEPNNLMYAAGLVYYFGGQKAAAQPVDSDNDGVIDSADQCPNTAAGVAVDALGCALPVDSDGDGVYDDADQCPNTAAGVAVDAFGCALPVDSDGDGVYDNLDRCPDSPRGARVDEHGCPLVLSLNIQFDSNKATIRPQHVQDLNNAAAFINAHPKEKIIIAGYTDSDGDSNYNQRLSLQRAQAVLDYLVKNYSIAASQLTAQGFGELHPIADNQSATGKQLNRRVELSLRSN